MSKIKTTSTLWKIIVKYYVIVFVIVFNDDEIDEKVRMKIMMLTKKY